MNHRKRLSSHEQTKSSGTFGGNMARTNSPKRVKELIRKNLPSKRKEEIGESLTQMGFFDKA